MGTGLDTLTRVNESLAKILVRVREYAAIFAVWTVAVFGPLMATDPHTESAPWFWIIIAVVVAIFTYDGIRAWHRGSRAPLMIKVVVPLVLLLISCTMLWMGVWDRSQ